MPTVSPDEPRPGWLTRNLKVVSAVSFLQDAASELLYPILPIFLTVTLGAPVAVVGLIEGLAEGAASLTRLAAGPLAARYRRTPLIAVGYGLAGLGKLLIAVAGAWPVVLAGRAVDRLGKGIRGAPRDGLIAADVPAAMRGRAFGFHRAMDTAGAVVGPLLGLAGYELLDHRLRPLLIIAVVPAVLSATLVALLRDPDDAGRAPGLRRAPPDPAPAAAVGVSPDRDGTPLPPAFWRVVAVLTGFSLVNFPDALLILRLHDVGFGVVAVIAAYVLYNVVYAVLSYPAGRAADRFTPPVVFGLGLACFAIAYLGLGLTRDHLAAWLLMAVYGGYTALTDGVGKAWVSGLLPDARQTSGQGLFQGLSGFGVLAAGVWAGLAWHGDGRLPLLVSGAVAALVAGALLLSVGRHRPLSPARS